MWFTAPIENGAFSWREKRGFGRSLHTSLMKLTGYLRTWIHLWFAPSIGSAHRSKAHEGDFVITVFWIIFAVVWLCPAVETINFDRSGVISCLTISFSLFFLCWVLTLYTFPSFNSMSILPRHSSTWNDCRLLRLRCICPVSGTSPVSRLLVCRTIPFRAWAHL